MAIPLEPITVRARRSTALHDDTLEGFYARLAVSPSLGSNRVLGCRHREFTMANRPDLAFETIEPARSRDQFSCRSMPTDELAGSR